jgi:hypothetical protein
MQRTAKRFAPILAYAGLIASVAFGFLVITADDSHRAVSATSGPALELFTTRIEASALPPG